MVLCLDMEVERDRSFPLERGATQDRDLFDWFEDVACTAFITGGPGATLRRWSLFQAWPIKFVAGDWDNESDENVIESVTPPYDLFDLEQ